MKSMILRFGTVFSLICAGVVMGLVLSGTTQNTPSVSATPASSAGSAGVKLALPDIADIAERINPAVVSITSTEVVEGSARSPHDFFDYWFFPRPRPREEDPDQQDRQERSSGGSGFIISEDGYILTNHHVVEDADKVEVELADDKKIVATLVGSDPDTDIALLKIDEKNLPFVPLGDSDSVRVGEWVIAVGNPLYYDHTVTAGVVSAKGRRLNRDAKGSFDDFIQTDAAINFGNSGGPLINLDGQAIAINSAISARGQNIGFAIPINIAKSILPQLKTKGRVVRGYLGVSISNITPETKEDFDLPDRNGALVESVTPGFGAALAGMEHGDIVREVNGVRIETTKELIETVSGLPPGEKVKMKILRNGKEKTLTVTLSERPTDEQLASTGERPERQEDSKIQALLGVTVENLSARLRSQFSISERYDGVVVVQVARYGNAGRAGIMRGDLIVEINRKETSNVAAFSKEVAKFDFGDRILLYVVRNNAGRFVSVPLDPDEKP